jgi:hypothetical protein
MTARLASSSGLIAVLAVASLAIVGCGGSSSQHRASKGVFLPPGVGVGQSGAGSGSSVTADAGTGGGTGAAARKTTGASAAGSSGGSSAAPRITFAAPGGQSAPTFVASADAICRSFRAHARQIGAGATTLAAQETELGHLVTVTEQSIRSLTDLSPPTPEAAGLRRFATMTVASVVAFAEAQSRTRSTSETVGSQVEAHDLAAAQRSAHDAAAASAAARQLGLHVCGSAGAAWL